MERGWMQTFFQESDENSLVYSYQIAVALLYY